MKLFYLFIQLLLEMVRSGLTAQICKKCDCTRDKMAEWPEIMLKGDTTYEDGFMSK